MISEEEKKLIHLLVDLGASNDLINAVCMGLTDNQLLYARLYLQRLQEKKDIITESDMIRARIIAKNRV